MSLESMIDYKLEKLEDIIKHNEESLTITKNIRTGSFLNIKDEIFYLVNFFSSIDDSFKDKLLEQLLNDVLHFLDIFAQIENTNFEEICSKEGTVTPTKDLKEAFESKLKSNKLKVISLLNTRLYCIDLQMWKLVKESKKIKRFVNIFEVGNVKNTQEFLKIQKYNLKPMFKSHFISSSNNYKPTYNDKDIQFLKSLEMIEEEELSEGIEYLLKSKDSIGFFSNMSEEEIKLITKDVKFIKCSNSEIITKQGDNHEEMFLILSGECTVVQDNKIVGSLGPNQVFGEFSKITNKKRFSTVITKVPSTLLSFNLKLELFDEAPFSFSTLYKNILAELVAKIDISNQHRPK